MDLWKLFAIFVLIIAFVKYRFPLWSAILGGMALTALLFRVPPAAAVRLIYMASISWDTIVLLLAFYSITFLQRMMEKRRYLLRIEKAMERVFKNRRLNVMLTPMVIGLLPSAGAVLLAAPIVDRSCGDYISREEKAFIASYYRHIPESFLPTYSSILIALQLSGQDMTKFVLLMLPLVAVLMFLGYVFYVRHVPAWVDEKEMASLTREQARRDLFICLSPIAATVTLSLVFKVPVYLAVFCIATIFALAARFSVKELLPMFLSAAEVKLLFTTTVIMQFKDILVYTGVLGRLPDYFSGLPLPPAIIFGIIFFIGTLISGGQAMIALCLTTSLTAVQGGGSGFFVFVMSIIYIAMQISPAHICLEIAAGAFGINFLDLVKKTLPVLLCFMVICAVYCRGIYLLGL